MKRCAQGLRGLQAPQRPIKHPYQRPRARPRISLCKTALGNSMEKAIEEIDDLLYRVQSHTSSRARHGATETVQQPKPCAEQRGREEVRTCSSVSWSAIMYKGVEVCACLRKRRRWNLNLNLHCLGEPLLLHSFKLNPAFPLFLLSLPLSLFPAVSLSRHWELCYNYLFSPHLSPHITPLVFALSCRTMCTVGEGGRSFIAPECPHIALLGHFARPTPSFTGNWRSSQLPQTSPQ